LRPSLERCLGCSLMTGTPITTSCSVFPCICSHAHPVAVSCLPPGPSASVGNDVEGVVVVRRDTAERGAQTDTHPHTTMSTQQRAQGAWTHSKSTNLKIHLQEFNSVAGRRHGIRLYRAQQSSARHGILAGPAAAARALRGSARVALDVDTIIIVRSAAVLRRAG